MTEITDEYMRQALAQLKDYTLVIMKTSHGQMPDGSGEILWEHGRQNFLLRSQGLLSIVCPVRDGSGIAGIGIFNASPAEVRANMDADPAVQAGILTYEIHPCRSFPHDFLPG